MKAQAFPLLVVAGPHANSRLGVVEAGRGLRELSAWLREREARALIFTEGEWDLAAAADLMAWGLSDRTKRVAIFGLRGGRNLAHTLGYQWPGEAQAFLFSAD